MFNRKYDGMGVSKMMVKLVISMVCVFTLVACSSKPGSELVNQSIDKLTKSENVEGVFEIKNAKRENGFMLDDFYNVEISYERHCLLGIEDASLKMNDLEIDQDPKNLVEGMLKEFIGMIAESGVLQYKLEEEYGAFKQGDILQETATLKFIKTEQGWMEYQPETE